MLKLKTILFLMLAFNLMANATDQEQAAKLKDELRFDTERRNDFKNQSKNQKIFENEREKGLSLFLEEQEKWDLTREKGINQQRAARRREKTMDQEGPEYFQDLKLKQKVEQQLEVARKKHIQTKKEITAMFKHKLLVTEEEELAVNNSRPRYTLRLRGQNKWVTRGSKSGAGSSTSNSSLPSPGSSNFDYQPPANNEYIPTDNFEELPPPPPMMPYEGYANPGAGPGGDFYDPSGNAQPNIGYPPPPPPEGGWDF